MDNEPEGQERLTMWQRYAMRGVRRQAGKRRGEPLSAEDWPAMWELGHSRGGRMLHRLWHALPNGPRCGMCGAPFAGPGRILTRPLGYRPSRKNPNLCATCVEMSPPGGATMDAGILFADLRGFTASSEDMDPESVSRLLRRFYGCAEKALFPEAIIDKLIGDEVMALYLPEMIGEVTSDETCELMVQHARNLLDLVGYGTAEGPFVEVGVGIGFGEAFVGNIGDRAIYDFTAVGDVVNTASRLQGHADSGEIVISERVGAGLGTPIGERVEVQLKGKAEPTIAIRISDFKARA